MLNIKTYKDTWQIIYIIKTYKIFLGCETTASDVCGYVFVSLFWHFYNLLISEPTHVKETTESKIFSQYLQRNRSKVARVADCLMMNVTQSRSWMCISSTCQVTGQISWHIQTSFAAVERFFSIGGKTSAR